MTDASPCGIATSLYQEDNQGKWVPVDYTSRALSVYEQGWDLQIDWESLVKVWGRAPERWERWERVPSQFEILAATFG